MIHIYGIKNCDSTKKALSFLKKNSLEFTFHDYKEEQVGCDKIESWLQKTTLKQLFNKRSTTYKTLNLKELNLDENAQKEWLCKENILIKRPVLEYKNKLLVGFKQEEYEGELL